MKRTNEDKNKVNQHSDNKMENHYLPTRELNDNRSSTAVQKEINNIANIQFFQSNKKNNTNTNALSLNSIEPVQQKQNNTGLPDNLRSGIENLSGLSMEDVKVHYNSTKPTLLNAHAYAQGNDIHIASGQEKYLPHEAWHVVQQKQGRVKPTKQLKGKIKMNDDAGLENEADIMGEKAILSETKDSQIQLFPKKSKTVNGANIVQRNLKPSTIRDANDEEFTLNGKKIGVASVKKNSNIFIIPNVWDPKPIRIQQEIVVDGDLTDTTDISVVSGTIVDKSSNSQLIWVEESNLKQTADHLEEKPTARVINSGSRIWKRKKSDASELFSNKPAAVLLDDKEIELNDDSKVHKWRGPIEHKGQNYWALDGDIEGVRTEKVDFDPSSAQWTPTAEDVVQGNIGDCYLLAALKVIVRTEPNLIKRLFVNINADRIGVKIFYNSSWRQINLKKTKFIRIGNNNDRFALKSAWVQLIEKAFTYTFGKLEQSKDKADFSVLESKLGRDALTSITGVVADFKKQPGRTNVINELKKSGIVIAATKKGIKGRKSGVGHSANEQKVEGLVAEHSYAVLGAFLSKTLKKNPPGYYPPSAENIKSVPDVSNDFILLENPWGKYGRTYDAEGTRKEDSSENSGVFWITIKDFKSDFMNISFLKKHF